MLNKDWVKKLSEKHLYIIAIITVAILILLNQFVIQRLLVERKDDAVVINLAGRQRMLSQKIGLYSHQVMTGSRKLDSLREELQTWNEVHEGLRYGNKELRLPPNTNPEISVLFEELEPYQNRVMQEVSSVKNAQEMEARLPEISENIASFLPLMDRIVLEFQEQSEEEMQQLIFLEMLIAGISLLVLVFEFQFIFRPILKELSRKNKKLERISLSKDRVMATVVHDLRNPLNGIKGMTGLLQENLEERYQLDDEDEMIFNLIKDSSDKMNDLIQELLDISVIESEDYHLETEVTHIKEYLVSAISQYKPRAKEKGVELDVEVEGDDLKMKLDKQKFSRVLDNLISNALKFTDSPGEVKVQSYPEGNNLIIKVVDDGIGIPEDMQQIIFDKFSKARRLGLQGEKTTGLGMSIVKQIVEHHDGEVWLESQENEGTAFYISLPFKEAA